MDIFGGDSSFCLVVASSMIIGSFDYGWGLPTLILVPLLALKYMEVCLFLFPFCFGGVLKTTSIATASLANISGDFSSCYSFSLLPVEIPMSTVSVFGGTILGYFFPFYLCVSTLVVTYFIWAFLAFFFPTFSPFSPSLFLLFSPFLSYAQQFCQIHLLS